MADYFPLINISKWTGNIGRECGSDLSRHFSTVSQLNKKSLETLLRPEICGEELVVELTVQREFEQQAPRWPFENQEPDPLMNPPEGVERPLGYVQFFHDAEPNDLLLVVRLYVGMEVFDELWARHVNGGPMPFRLEIRVEGLSWGGSDHVWAWESKPRLPISSFWFRAAADVVFIPPSP